MRSGPSISTTVASPKMLEAASMLSDELWTELSEGLRAFARVSKALDNKAKLC